MWNHSIILFGVETLTIFCILHSHLMNLINKNMTSYNMLITNIISNIRIWKVEFVEFVHYQFVFLSFIYNLIPCIWIEFLCINPSHFSNKNPNLYNYSKHLTMGTNWAIPTKLSIGSYGVLPLEEANTRVHV